MGTSERQRLRNGTNDNSESNEPNDINESNVFRFRVDNSHY